MNKKLMITLTAVLVLLMIILGVLLGMGRNAPVKPTTEPTVETTEEMLPGLDDSIFDLPEEELAAILVTEAPVETEETKPPVTVPADSTHVHNGGNDDEKKPEIPDAPKNNKPQSTTPTKPSEPDPTQPTEKNPDPTQSTTPTPQEPEDTVQCEFEKYHSMSPADQRAYMEGFENIEAFFDWYNEVKADHEELHPSVDISDGKINLSDYE